MSFNRLMIGWAACLFLLVASPASAASFRCDGFLNPTESAICADPALSQADDLMAERYHAIEASYGARGWDFAPAAAEQRSWLQQRDSCVNETACIADAYRERAAALDAYSERLAAPDEPQVTTDLVGDAPVASEPGAVETTAAPAPPAAQGSADAPTDDDWSAVGLVIGIVIGVGLALAAYFAPTIIAVRRRHAYAGVIFAVNIFAAWTFVGWILVLVWAVWPKEKALIDPVVGNVTGTGVRNAGDVLGSVDEGRARGARGERVRTGQSADALVEADLVRLERMAQLHQQGALTSEEFTEAKKAILNGR